MKLTNRLNEFAENIINTVREPLLVLDKDLRVIKASRSFYNFFKVTSDETIGVLIYELGNNQWDIPKLRELLETILPEKTTFDDYEVEHDFSTIGKRTMLLNARQIKRAFGKEKVILLAIEDITERKHEEESLSETSRMTSEYLDILVNHAHVPIIIWDASFIITRFNYAFEKLSGYHISEVIGRKIDFLFPADKINSTIELLKNTFGGEKSEIIEIDILRKDEDIRTVLWNSENVFDKEGRIIVATIAQDITTSKRNAEAIAVLETRYRRLFESAKDGILILDAETGMIIDVNPFLVELLGYSHDKFVEKAIWEIGFFKDIADNENKFFELQQREYVRYEDLPLETFDGRKINVEFISNVYSVNHRKVVQCNIRDITRRKRTEESLRESYQINKEIVNSIPVRVFWKDKNLLYLGCNKAFALDAGLADPIEIIGKDDFQIGWREQAELYREDDRKVIETGISKLFMEEPQTTPEGNNITLLTSKIPLLNSKGEIIGVIGTYFDITERKQAEEEIAMLAHSLKSINECVSITDLEDKIIFVNESFLKTYGYNENELIGKQINVIRSINNSSELVEEILPATIHGEWQGELLNKRKDGSEFMVHLSTTIINDKDGRPLGLIGVASDITNHKKMVNDLLKLSRAVEQSPSSIIITDIKGNIEYVNPKVTDVTGYHFTELQGKNPKIFSTGEKSADDYKILWNTIISGKEWHGEFHNKKKNGELYWESASITSIKNDNEEITHYLAVTEDITERKLAEIELIEAKERAEQSDKLKSEFLTQMSHEIRTPLSTIVGNVELLGDSFRKEMFPDLLDCFDSIDIATKRIIRTIDLLLNAAELQTSDYKPNFIKVDLNSQVFIKLFQEHQPSAKQKGLEFIYKCELKETIILADEYSVYQIFANLIDNAIKYTKKGKVEILLEKNKSGNITAEIKDTGIGISKEFLPKLFDVFTQEEQGYTRKFDGNGLGLSLVKRYCGLNNALVEVESEKKVGTTFRVIFA